MINIYIYLFPLFQYVYIYIYIYIAICIYIYFPYLYRFLLILMRNAILYNCKLYSVLPTDMSFLSSLVKHFLDSIETIHRERANLVANVSFALRINQLHRLIFVSRTESISPVVRLFSFNYLLFVIFCCTRSLIPSSSLT